eukprot:m.137058 g.137058  ORF g.137058 m.137058 type:complete len:260 (-) comp23976_c0_seq10:56-835(-)
MEASASCQTIYQVFSKQSGFYFVARNANYSANASLTLCANGVAYGGNGTSRELAIRSCLHLYTYSDSPESGIFWIDPTGTDPYQVYCYQEDGGGWMRWLGYKGQNYAPTAAGFGNIAEFSSSGKLSDARINALGSGWKLYRLVSSLTSRNVYLRSQTLVQDRSRAWNIFSTGERYICQATSYAACTLRRSTHPTLDTLGDRAVPNTGNDVHRHFTDYSGTRQCYSKCSNTCRCVNCGASCSNHEPIDPYEAYVRQQTLA